MCFVSCRFASLFFFHFRFYFVSHLQRRAVTPLYLNCNQSLWKRSKWRFLCKYQFRWLLRTTNCDNLFRQLDFHIFDFLSKWNFLRLLFIYFVRSPEMFTTTRAEQWQRNVIQGYSMLYIESILSPQSLCILAISHSSWLAVPMGIRHVAYVMPHNGIASVYYL